MELIWTTYMVALKTHRQKDIDGMICLIRNVTFIEGRICLSRSVTFIQWMICLMRSVTFAWGLPWDQKLVRNVSSIVGGQRGDKGNVSPLEIGVTYSNHNHEENVIDKNGRKVIYKVDYFQQKIYPLNFMSVHVILWRLIYRMAHLHPLGPSMVSLIQNSNGHIKA